MNFLLKIVEGPMKGAEVALVAGTRLKVGSADSCDIVLADATLGDEPLVIEVSADSVTLGGERLERNRERRPVRVVAGRGQDELSVQVDFGVLVVEHLRRHAEELLGTRRVREVAAEPNRLRRPVGIHLRVRVVARDGLVAEPAARARPRGVIEGRLRPFRRRLLGRQGAQGTQADHLPRCLDAGARCHRL